MFEQETERAPAEPTFTRAQVIDVARAEATRRRWTTPAGGTFYEAQSGLYGVGFYEPGHDHGDGGLGNPWLYFRGASQAVPGEGSAGDIFMQAQFPVHSGRIFGLAGRIAVTVVGLLVATLSATGLVIWFCRRRRKLTAALRPATTQSSS